MDGPTRVFDWWATYRDATLVVGAAMKLAYDAMLYASFRGLPPPEERASPAA